MPELEAWEKVYIGGANANAFLGSVHGQIACAACHGPGDPTSTDLDRIHFEMQRDPSASDGIKIKER